MDKVLKTILERRSVRDFLKKEIPKDIIEKLIQALIWAPSAGNLQARKFYFVTDPVLKKNLAAAALGQSFIAEAPLVVVACTDRQIESKYGEKGVNLYAVQDTACSIMNMMLVACENGLGTLWVGAFKEGEAFEVLDLPDNLRPVAIVPVGYPAKVPAAPQRVPVEKAIIHR